MSGASRILSRKESSPGAGKLPGSFCACWLAICITSPFGIHPKEMMFMTRLFVLLAVVMLAFSPAWAAPKDKKDRKDDNRPSGSEIADEAAKAKFEKERAIEKRYGKGSDVVRF